jgi:hypothetical protein
MKNVSIFTGILLFLFLSWKIAQAATNQVQIKAGQVFIRGGYVAIGSTQAVTLAAVSTTGQCIGILCGVTHAN